jgi:hypothetical protein
MMSVICAFASFPGNVCIVKSRNIRFLESYCSLLSGLFIFSAISCYR